MSLLLDRHWLLTSTTYGTWLPGDERGFVSPVRVEHSRSERHNRPNTAYDASRPKLRRWASEQLRCEPIWLSPQQAQIVSKQFEETADYRNWRLICTAVMGNHFHAVMSVPGDPDPSKLLQSLKSYASRALNSQFGKPRSETWWTRSGSRRKLSTKHAVIAATKYVWRQAYCLARYADPEVPPDWLA